MLLLTRTDVSLSMHSRFYPAVSPLDAEVAGAMQSSVKRSAAAAGRLRAVIRATAEQITDKNKGRWTRFVQRQQQQQQQQYVRHIANE